MPTLDELNASRRLAIEAAEATLENAKPAWEQAQVTHHEVLVAAGKARDAGYKPFGDAYNAAKATAQVAYDAQEAVYKTVIKNRDDDVAAAEQTYRDDVIAEQEAQRAAP